MAERVRYFCGTFVENCVHISRAASDLKQMSQIKIKSLSSFSLKSFCHGIELQAKN